MTSRTVARAGLLLGGLLFFCSLPAVVRAADTHPDFSGSWIVDSVSTTGGEGHDNGDTHRGGGGGGGGFGGGFGRGGFGHGGGRGSGGGGGGGGGTGDRAGGRGRGGEGGEALPHFERGQHVEITQTATELTEAIAPDAGGKIVHYPLDGSDGYTSGPNGGALKTKTTWDSLALISEFKATEGGGKFKAREVRTLGTDGRVTVETTIETGSGKRTVTATLSRREG